MDLGAQWLEPALARELAGKPVTVGAQAAIFLKGRELKQDEYARYAKLSTDYAQKAMELRAKLPGLDPRAVIGATEPLEQLALAQLARQPPFEERMTLGEGVGAAIVRWAAKVPVKTGVRVARIDSTGELIRLITPAGDVQDAGRDRHRADDGAAERRPTFCAGALCGQAGRARGPADARPCQGFPRLLAAGDRRAGRICT